MTLLSTDISLRAVAHVHRQGDGQRIALYEADITMLMQRYRAQTGPLLAVLEPFVDPDAVVELKQIAREIQQRIARMDKAKQQL